MWEYRKNYRRNFNGYKATHKQGNQKANRLQKRRL